MRNPFTEPKTSRTAKLAVALAASAAILSGCDKADPATGPSSTALIIINSPAPGEVLHVGDSLRVTWALKSDPVRTVQSVLISLSPDNGAYWYKGMHTNAITATKGKFSWLITDSVYISTLNKKLPLKGSKTCKIKVEEYDIKTDPDMTVTSEAFTIDP